MIIFFTYGWQVIYICMYIQVVKNSIVLQQPVYVMKNVLLEAEQRKFEVLAVFTQYAA